MSTKIYVLVAYTKDGKIADLGYAEELEMVQEEIHSEDTKNQLVTLGMSDVEFMIRDNQYPTNYYPLGV